MRFNDLAISTARNPKPEEVAAAKRGGHVVLAELLRDRNPAERMLTLEVSEEEFEVSSLHQKTAEQLDALCEDDSRRLFVLQPRLVDVNVPKLLHHMKEDVDARANGVRTLAEMLLCDTSAFAGRCPSPLLQAPGDEDSAHLRDGYAGFTMTGSQEDTYAHLCEHALTVVWGPPGAGKTYFLAAAICRMLIASIAAEQPMRVMVTAFTNEALDLLLKKVRARRRVCSRRPPARPPCA